jgi:hypothetical protein
MTIVKKKKKKNPMKSALIIEPIIFSKQLNYWIKKRKRKRVNAKDL